MIAALLLLACAPEEEAPAATGETVTLVMDTLTFARRADDGTTWGFDLDGRVSDTSDADGCYKADYVTPDGLTGVDSAFSGIVPALEATEASAVEDLIQDSIQNGQLLLLVEVTGVDDPLNDDCVGVQVWRGEGVPMLGTDGQLLDGQTFAVDPALSSDKVECATLTDGSVLAGPLTLDLPLQVLDVEVSFHVEEVYLRLDLTDEGPGWGYYGGAVPNEDILRIVEEENDLGGIRDLVVTLVEASADLRPQAGVCTALSIVFEYTARPAFVYGE